MKLSVDDLVHFILTQYTFFYDIFCHLCQAFAIYEDKWF